MSQNGSGAVVRLDQPFPPFGGPPVCIAEADQAIEALLMPYVDEFRRRFDEIKETLGDVRRDLKDGLKAEADERRRIEDVLDGTPGVKGLKARIESLEGDRDAAKLQAAEARAQAESDRASLKATVNNMKVGILIAFIPIVWEIIQHFVH